MDGGRQGLHVSGPVSMSVVDGFFLPFLFGCVLISFALWSPKVSERENSQAR